MSAFLQDLRQALRMLRRSPGFGVVATLTLALGIGINTTIFSGISALLLRPLPYAHAERLVDFRPLGSNQTTNKAMLVQLRERLSSFDAIASYNRWTFTLTGDGQAERVPAVRATGNVFDVLGANPLLGRTLLASDSAPGAERVVVLSYRFWQRRLDGDPSVVGRTLHLNEGGSTGGPTRVVGVMPADFAFPAATDELWAPNPLDTAGRDYNTSYLELLGRLAPGVNIAAAEREISATLTGLCAETAGCDAKRLGKPRILPLRDVLVGAVQPVMLLLLGAVGFVLLIACANVANLLLARAAARERELAIRAALGAGRLRVARQLLTESLAVAVIGGVTGVVTAAWASSLLRAALPTELIGAADIRVDLRVLAFAVAAVVVAAVLAGIFPAVGATRTQLHGALLDRGAAGTSRTRRRALGVLVVTEFALALVLAIGAGLMIRTFANLSAESPGFDRAGVLSLSVSPPSSYDGPASRRFWRELLDRVRTLPGVQSAGAIHLLPLGLSNWVNAFLIEDRPLPQGDPPREIDWRSTTPGYFETLRIPLVRGRLFTDQEHEAAAWVVVINDTAAKRYFAGEDPIGRRVRTPTFEGNDWATIVGVVGDTKDQTLAAPARPQMYRLQAPFVPAMTLMVRAAGDPLQLVGPIREVVRAIDADVAVGDFQSLEHVVGDSIAQPRLLTRLLFGFGALALLLGAVGLYGVMAYGTLQRTREFGVRLALGAGTREVLGLVARDALRLVGIGAVIGLVGALAMSRVLKSQLYEVSAVDPVVFAGAAAVLAAVALAAALVPALRAARTDPAEALRWE